MTYDERQAKGTILCGKLFAHVGLITPEGIGYWDRAWEIALPAQAHFWVMLTAWEIDPSDMTMQRVSDAYDGVLEAWRIAAHEFTTERSEA